MTKKITKLMLNGQEYEIREYQAGWQPGANTVAYYPLTSQTTVNNQVTGGTNLTNYNCVFGISNGVDCVTISGNSTSSFQSLTTYLTGNISGLPTGNLPRTFNFWCYLSNASTTYDEMYIVQGNTCSNNEMVMCASDGVDGQGYWISQYGAGSGTAFGSTLRQQWVHHAIVYDGSKFEWYINGVSRGTWSYTINTANSTLKLGGADNQGWNAFNGSYSNFIIEDKARTAQEVSDYYNQTKSLYGIS